MKQLFVLACLLMNIFTSPLCAGENDDTKIYIPREAVVVTEESIALIIGDDDYFPLDALYVDINGLFIYESQITAKSCKPRL
jgi:hypothetical protein